MVCRIELGAGSLNDGISPLGSSVFPKLERAALRNFRNRDRRLGWARQIAYVHLVRKPLLLSITLKNAITHVRRRRLNYSSYVET